MIGRFLYKKVPKLGPYQIENLLNNQVKFYFFDIRGASKESEKLKIRIPWLEIVNKKNAFSKICSSVSDKSAPILVVCSKGYDSAVVVSKLVKDGYLNAYISENGAASVTDSLN